jgi:hypothetical protein
MRKQLWMAMLVSMALVFAIAAPVTANHGQQDQTVPFRAVVTTHDPAEPYPAPTCVGGAWDIATSGWAVTSHLGIAEWEQSHCTHFDFATYTAFTENGRATLTAPNGDTVELAYVATFTADAQYAYLSIDWEITGGTGRFLHASGSGTGWGQGDYVVTLTTHSTWVGTLTYDASDHSSG